MHLQIAHEPLQPNRWADRDTTFAGMLQNLVDSTAAASEAKSMGRPLSCDTRKGSCPAMAHAVLQRLRWNFRSASSTAAIGGVLSTEPLSFEFSEALCAVRCWCRGAAL